MKTTKSPLGLKSLKGGALLAMAISSLMMSINTYANTSAGTVLHNSVSVAYKDTGGTSQTPVVATVDVTVDLVPAVAWGTAPSNQTIGSNTALPTSYTLTLTNKGNGADTYSITDNTVQTCTVGTLGAEGFSPTASVSLGATVQSGTAVFGGVNTTIPVSNLVSGAGGFQAGDSVLIGASATVFTVVSATDSGGSPANSTPDTLVVSGDATAAATGAGIQIGERQTVTYGATGNSGTLSSGGSCQHEHALTATGTLATGGNTQVAQGTGANYWQTLVRGVTLTVTKYVRNLTAGKNASGTGSISYGGNTYYASGITGNPGQTLEYLVLTTNSSSADAANVIFSDTLPLYTTYVTNSLFLDANGDGTMDTTVVGDTTAVDAVNPHGIFKLIAGVLTVYAGVGGNEDAGTGGSVQDVGQAANNPSNKTAMIYKVTID